MVYSVLIRLSDINNTRFIGCNWTLQSLNTNSVFDKGKFIHKEWEREFSLFLFRIISSEEWDLFIERDWDLTEFINVYDEIFRVFKKDPRLIFV